jgi:hypothetical protein
MEELIGAVAQKTGMSQEDAQKAVMVVIDFLKSKLPSPIAGHLDSLLSGGASGELNTLEGEAENLIKGKLGGLFGGTA